MLMNEKKNISQRFQRPIARDSKTRTRPHEATKLAAQILYNLQTSIIIKMKALMSVFRSNQVLVYAGVFYMRKGNCHFSNALINIKCVVVKMSMVVFVWDTGRHKISMGCLIKIRSIISYLKLGKSLLTYPRAITAFVFKK